jgi:hypothetical protein
MTMHVRGGVNARCGVGGPSLDVQWPPRGCCDASGQQVTDFSRTERTWTGMRLGFPVRRVRSRQ